MRALSTLAIFAAWCVLVVEPFVPRAQAINPFFFGQTGGFLPTNFSGCKLWLDATQITGVADGNTVQTPSDYSGNSNTVTQATSGSRATYRTSGINSRPALEFDGTDDYYSGSHTWASSVSGFTVFVVLKTDSATANQCALITDAQDIRFQQFSNARYTGIGAANYGSVANSSTSGQYMSLVYDGSQSGNANRLKLYIGGAQQTLSFSGTIPATSNAQTTLVVGRYNTTSPYWDGMIGEVIGYNRALSSTERTAVESYLAGKWGL